MSSSKPILKNNNSTSPNPDEAKQIESNQAESNEEKITVPIIVDRINKLSGLSNYDIRQLVKDAQHIGQRLQGNREQDKLKTNQVRKFLDAINRIKAEALDQDKTSFEIIKIPIVLLKPKLAYAAARQEAAKPLQQVLDAAIDQVHSDKDFERLVQLVESIIAYHKAAGGKD